MTIWVRLRSSTTTSECLSPTLRSLALSAIVRSSSALLDDFLGANADALNRHDELAVLIEVLGDGLGEDQLSAPLPRLLIRLARASHRSQHVTGAKVAVVLEVLLGVEATGGRPGALTFLLLPLHAGGLLAGPEP